MIERLDSIEKKYESIKEELTKEEVLTNVNKLKELSKKQSELEEVVSKYKEYKSILKSISDDKELLNDELLKDMAEEELKKLENAKESLEKELELDSWCSRW